MPEAAPVWPPDYDSEIFRRYRIIEKAKNDEQVRRDLHQYYALSPADWINDFCVTFDPRVQKPAYKLMPFVLFQRQREFVQFLLDCLTESENGLAEKARDMGLSWICCAFSTWLWLYHDGSAIGFGSRKEDYVDKKGDPKALFPKIRQIMQKLPAFMMPKDWNPLAHSSHMKIINPNNDSTITGEAGDNMGRGGRTTIYFKDESAHYEHPDLIEAALGDNTNVQIDISSVNGTANVFYRRRRAGKIWTPDTKIEKGVTRVFIMDWRDHPAKTQEWYDRRRQRSESEGLLHLFAQEVDRDYSSAVEGVIIPQLWVKASIDAHIKLGFKPGGERIGGFDPYDGGGDQHAFAWREGVVLRQGKHWSEGDTGDATRLVVEECQMNGIYELYYDSIGVGAGVKSEANRLEKAQKLVKGLRIMPWNASADPLDKDKNIIRGDKDSPKEGDVFDNLKAQSWWRLRIRFEKTYKAITKGAKYNQHELISLPSDLPMLHDICDEISQAVRKTSYLTGKMLVDKKPAGSSSPNIADAVVQCYNPVRKLSILDVI